MENSMRSFLIISLMLSIALAYPTGDPLEGDLAETMMKSSSDGKLVDSDNTTANNSTKPNGDLNKNNETNSDNSTTTKNGEEDEESQDDDPPDGDTTGSDPTPDDGPQSKEEQLKEIESEEDTNVFEGDLRLDNDTMADISNQTDANRRDVISNKKRHWKDGRVPYTFAGNYDRKRKECVRKAIAMFNKDTCVKFVRKKASDKDYIQFMIDPKYCYSTSIGKSPRGGKQKISIGNGCNYVGVVLHEMMHAIGFYHEQSRLDRDDYISILWNNIDQNMESQFKKYAHGDADYFGEPYDFKSLMHYPKTAFGKNGAVTIVPKNKQWTKLGQRNVFSKIDLAQINKAYNCNKGQGSNDGKDGGGGGGEGCGGKRDC